VEGVAVVNGRHHAFVPHGSHGITFRHTIAKGTTGDAYWWDDPGTNDGSTSSSGPSIDNTNDVLYDHALAIGVSVGNRGGGFRLGAGSGNVIRNSAAIQVRGGNGCAGFVWPERSQGVWGFHDNFASSEDCHGIFVWQNDERLHVIDGFSGDGIDHGAYNNDYVYRDVDIPYLNVHAAGWRMDNSSVDRLTAFRNRQSLPVTFANVTVGEFIVNNGANGGEVPGDYVFTGTNLTCGDVVYQTVVPGTKVTINGARC
jgi:hypothetical protein